MKKLTAMVLSALLLCAAASCTPQNSAASPGKETAAETTAPAATAAASPKPSTVDSAKQAAVAETVDAHSFEGVIYAVQNGETVAFFANGTSEDGGELTVDTPMPIGSVSKQFCAAAVLLLQEQGKLSIDDTLDKYFPEYTEGKKNTLKNLLAMRSGIPEMTAEGNGDLVTNDKTEEENTAAIKEWVFKQPLIAEPDTAFNYCNINYFLLGNIVEQVSGKKYVDFLRESFFAPLGMNHTGAISELADSPGWAQGATYRQLDTQPGLTKGCGDLIASAADMTVWLNALGSGNAVSAESFLAMTADYSPDVRYGFGMYVDIEGGAGHPGAIGIYSAYDYLNTDRQFTLFACNDSIDPVSVDGLAADLLDDLL